MNAERGNATLELVTITVPFLAVVMFVVLAGRMVAAQGTLDGAARAGARAAAAARAGTEADEAARRAVAADVEGSKVGCERLEVDVDTSDFRAGGTVRVALTCDLAVADLSPLPLPGTRTVTSRSIAVVDVHRGMQ
ncbi:MAG: TadE/TadG family type IV pilus assembly protein [Actinomycetota bacterium]